MQNEEKDIFTVIGKLPGYSKLLIKLYKSPDVRRRHKALLSLGMLYNVSPIEVIPGIIPVAGQLDNLLIMLRCLKKVLDASTPDSREQFLEETGVTIEELNADIKLTGDTLKAIGRGTVQLAVNTVKYAGLSALYGFKKLTRKKPF